MLIFYRYLELASSETSKHENALRYSQTSIFTQVIKQTKNNTFVSCVRYSSRKMSVVIVAAVNVVFILSRFFLFPLSLTINSTFIKKRLSWKTSKKPQPTSTRIPTAKQKPWPPLVITIRGLPQTWSQEHTAPSYEDSAIRISSMKANSHCYEYSSQTYLELQ